MTPYKALYGRRRQSLVCWFEGGERALYGTELVDEATKKIKEIPKRLQMAQYRRNIMMLVINMLNFKQVIIYFSKLVL
ncbi:hypothetical protein AXF42_Ash004868 [Apostasia shenzhenica]|uniref:Uncharacterized protein n=1 Tax=Apostasia shenzhenica TaxID=1088818 RepID=A0A2I0B7S9_9ASPA|nr:hypothetical protein AXF42_Ash004868 [Apostasia shenzhenica]